MEMKAQIKKKKDSSFFSVYVDNREKAFNVLKMPLQLKAFKLSLHIPRRQMKSSPPPLLLSITIGG